MPDEIRPWILQYQVALGLSAYHALEEDDMEARDIMTPNVVRVGPDMPVGQAAKLMMDNQISAVPVVKDGELIGIVSEGDLFRRAELGTERHHSHWLEMFASGTSLAWDYVKSHGQTVADVMSRDVITVAPDTSLGEVAHILETRHVKRVPVLEEGRLVGIVSRANLVQVLAMQPAPPPQGAIVNDRKIRNALFEEMRRHKWAFAPTEANVTVENGVVYLWGFINAEVERDAMVVAARGIPGVKRVEDRMAHPPVYPTF
jgi:CBS domain-containing protein